MALNLAFGTGDPPPAAWPGPGPVVSSPTADTPFSSTPPVAPPDPTAPPPAAEPQPAETAVAERPPLTVLNHSRVKGLAARAAEDFTRGGWQVVEVGNTRYAVARTTVYFAPGQEAAAAALRVQFPAIARSAPRPAELPGSGLTVVVTREYPH